MDVDDGGLAGLGDARAVEGEAADPQGLAAAAVGVDRAAGPRIRRIERLILDNRPADAGAEQGDAAVLDLQSGRAWRRGLVLAGARRDYDRISVLRGIDGCLHVLLGAGLCRARGSLGGRGQRTGHAKQGIEQKQAKLQVAFHYYFLGSVRGTIRQAGWANIP